MTLPKLIVITTISLACWFVLFFGYAFGVLHDIAALGFVLVGGLSFMRLERATTGPMIDAPRARLAAHTILVCTVGLGLVLWLAPL